MDARIRERIFAAADRLQQTNGGGDGFPTVGAVRELAKVNMNDACVGMRDWRKAQTAQVAPVCVEVPAPLQQASADALQALWQAATALANDTLQAAQSAWQAERTELEALNQQVASAFETQAQELEDLKTLVGRAQAECAQSMADMKATQQRADALSQEDTLLRAAAEHARSRITELEQHAEVLRREHGQLLMAVISANRYIDEMRQMHTRELHDLKADQAAALQQVSDAHTACGPMLAVAREEAASLRGELTALRAQGIGRRDA
ncbi:DNA-binding protein [Duganella levis]|uniref:KfrA protein n=1 Tax=Duganella levis TaxID=2692169 RepID=A0ABW9W8T8_9BURK|nr:DNA-binding protein [Duganella levis]MYN30103.1 KfrA protein [Duganella levis]